MSEHRLVLVLLALSSLAAPSAAQTQARHPFGVDDWAGLHAATAVDVSRDGSTIRHTVSVRGQKGTSVDEWRTISPAGRDQRLLKLPKDFTPMGFTHDGALYGLFQVNGLAQFAVFLLKQGSVAATRWTTVILAAGVRKAAPSPDGSRFALLASANPADPHADAHAVIEAPQQSVYVVERNGTGGAWECPSLDHVGFSISNSGYAQSLPIAWSRDGSSLAQGRRFFEALLARGKTVRMVSYPGSGQFPAKWEQRRDVLRELVAWLTRYNAAAGEKRSSN